MHSAISILVMLLASQNVAPADDASNEFSVRVMPVLQARCIKCHGGEHPEAKPILAGPFTPDQLHSQSDLWLRVLEQIEAGSMPPEGADPLEPDSKRTVLNWIRNDFMQILIEQQRNEGRSRLRRLSQTEYANAVQDIFGVRPPVVRLTPGDGRVDGYDKVSAALPFSASATEGQLRIAEDLVNQMFQIPQTIETRRQWSRGSEQSKGHLLELDDNWNVSFNSDVNSGALKRVKHDVRKPGRHRLRMHVYAYQSTKSLPVGIYVGNVGGYPQILRLLKVVDVPPGTPATVETEVYLRTAWDSDGPGGDGIRLIPLGLGVPVPKNSLAKELGKGPGLAIQWVEIEELDESLPGQRLLLGELPPRLQEAMKSNKNLKQSKIPRAELEDVLGRTIGRIGARLFRRDMRDAEIAQALQGTLKALDAGESLKSAYAMTVVAMMTAPDFLCVIEKAGRLSDFELASRLSFFLWNSTPDDELLEVARQGVLTDPDMLRTQTERLLTDPKSDRFVEEFLNQWLGLWGIDNTTPDKDLYPEYDDELKISSKLETQATFRRMLDQNLSVRDFVAPKWAMINSRLAKLYGIPAVEGFQLREIALPQDTPFGGVWTQAAIMKVTANGTLTSPVKRGVWVAERLLGIRIPPPPGNIEPVSPDTRGAKTVREQLTLHSREASCKACHARFDPYGFALEGFDVMGGFRTRYRVAKSENSKTHDQKSLKWKDGLLVDCSGVTPDGKAFANLRELRRILAAVPEQLARGVTRHLITFGTGEPATPIDQLTIDAIVSSAAESDYGLRSIIHGVVQSELFRCK